MSVQKIIAEADKFLDRGKIPEAVEKLKFALQAEPMNQLATTKLANIYAAAGSKEKAAATFIALANRLSDAGKAQVAIAVYKQAIELTPGDIALKLRYAQECEGVGKVSDAQSQAQHVFQYYLRRKKYFDAANILPMLVRLNGKDERLKQAWLEVMQLSGAEKKLVHLLVALSGPPGMVSEEFAVGGEPASLSETVYEGLKRLVVFFPRDPKVAYAVAWSAYRRGQFQDFFHFLRECIRREPDFCLGVLLFARVLAEREKLNEAYFVFKYLKERLSADKSADEISTLNQLIEAFVEKNGWIAFVEQTDDQLLPAQFIAALAEGQAPLPVTESQTANSVSPPPIPSQISITMPFVNPPVSAVPVPDSVSIPAAPPAKKEITGASIAPPAEIELHLASEEMEIQHHSEKSDEKADVQSAPAEIPPPAPEEKHEVTDGTMVVRGAAVESSAPDPVPDSVLPPAPEPDPILEPIAAVRKPVEFQPQPQSPARPTFNPLEAAVIEQAANPVAENTDNEKTEMFSPMEIIGAANQAMSGYDDIKTQIKSDSPEPVPAPAELSPPAQPTSSIAQPTSSTMPSRTVGIQAPADEWHALKLDGAPTDMFSPIDVLKAQADSRPNGASLQDIATKMVSKVSSAASQSSASIESSPADSIIAEKSGDGRRQGFIPIPSENENMADDGPKVDMGEDLLDGATRILLASPPSSPTQKLLKEIQRDISKKEPAASDPSLMLRKAERFIAKRNYYLARKALRHAQALGAEEEVVKKRLGDIRRMELPDSLYQAVSSDGGERERSSDILERLEQEFEITEDSEASQEIENSIEAKLGIIFQENDPRTILDFGIGLHEMGLYRQAEQVFSRMVEEFPDFSFDAYYLAAVSKFSRKDYAGAVSILKKLSIDVDKTELEKIQIYYALGELFEKMSQNDRSKEFFRKVAELDSNYRNIRHKLEE